MANKKPPKKGYPQYSVQDYSKVKVDSKGKKYIHHLENPSDTIRVKRSYKEGDFVEEGYFENLFEGSRQGSNSNMLYNTPKMKHPSMMRMEKMTSKVAGMPMYPGNKSKHPQSAARMSVTDEGIKGLQYNNKGKNI